MGTGRIISEINNFFGVCFCFLGGGMGRAGPRLMQDLPGPGIEPIPPEVETQCLNHRTTKEVLKLTTFIELFHLKITYTS